MVDSIDHQSTFQSKFRTFADTLPKDLEHLWKWLFCIVQNNRQAWTKKKLEFGPCGERFVGFTTSQVLFVLNCLKRRNSCNVLRNNS